MAGSRLFDDVRITSTDEGIVDVLEQMPRVLEATALLGAAGHPGYQGNRDGFLIRLMATVTAQEIGLPAVKADRIALE